MIRWQWRCAMLYLNYVSLYLYLNFLHLKLPPFIPISCTRLYILFVSLYLNSVSLYLLDFPLLFPRLLLCLSLCNTSGTCQLFTFPLYLFYLNCVSLLCIFPLYVSVLYFNPLPVNSVSQPSTRISTLYISSVSQFCTSLCLSILYLNSVPFLYVSQTSLPYYQTTYIYTRLPYTSRQLSPPLLCLLLRLLQGRVRRTAGGQMGG